MAAKLGSTDVSFRLGSVTPASLRIGETTIWSAGSLPGAPTIDSAVNAFIQFTAPASDGGAPITDYLLYVDGSLYLGFNVTNNPPLEVTLEDVYAGAVVEVSAVNSFGEGPKSAPVTVTSAPGAPTINLAEFNAGQTVIQFVPPESDGGSAITGYVIYFDGVAETPDSLGFVEGIGWEALFSENYANLDARVAAVNAVGEGPQSEPVTVTAGPRTLYFTGAVDGDWAELGNWFDNAGGTVAAFSLPTEYDSVIASASITANSGDDLLVSGDEPTVANFTLNDPNADSFGLFITLNVTGNATFNGSAYNSAVLTGNATFNDSASTYLGNIIGNATFNDNAANFSGTVNGNAEFNGSSQNLGSITGDATFNGNSQNNGAVDGNATFNDASTHSGSVNGTATFNDSASNNGGTAGTFVPDPPPA